MTGNISPTDFSGQYNAGGMTPGGNWIGRIVNDITGKAAQNEFNAQQAALTREFNSAEAAKNRDWQTWMSNTAHQREVADLKAAGINPALSAGGQGASVGSGGAASASAASSVSGSSSNLISQIAKIAIAKGLEAKFTNSAMKAADNHELVAAKVRALASQEKANSASASYSAAREASLRADDADKHRGFGRLEDYL